MSLAAPIAPPPPVSPKPRRRRTPPAFPQAERVHAYARAVVAGEIIAGRLVRLACERHLRDLANAEALGLVWRPDRAEAFIVFCEQCIFLSEGKPLVLDGWQVFTGGSLFGWYGADGFRRYHTAYIEIGKGNGKTPFAAAVGLYGLLLDGEHAPEIYSAATAQEQAVIAWRDAKIMVESSPELRKRVQVQVGSLSVPARYGVFRALSAEHRSLDGKRPHIGIVDELHEHPSDLVVDKLSAGTKARRNSLILEITNSGVGRHTVCWRHHETSVAILEQRAQNEAWFAYVCGLDPCPECAAAGKVQPDIKCPRCDDWRDPAVWIKANPSIDTILPGSFLARQVNDARTMVSKENIVRRLHFCQWTEQSNRWLSLAAWDACAGPHESAALAESLRGLPCRAGLDAATVGDFSALVLMFQATGAELKSRWPALSKPAPPGASNGLPFALIPSATYYPILPFFFIPEDNLAERVRSTGLRFDLWRDQGFLETTPGNQTDYAWIEAKLVELGETYPIEEIAFDAWNVSDLVARLTGRGFACVPCRQGYATLSSPCKEFERDMLSRRLVHGGHPVLRWMAGNVTLSQDPAGNVKYDKEKSTEKIDGIAASIMARDRWLRRDPEPTGTPGVVFL